MNIKLKSTDKNKLKDMYNYQFTNHNVLNEYKEIPDIAMWEETDSELAKKNILELSSSIKYHIDFNKKLIDEITRLEMTIDIKNKRIDELNKRLDKKGKRINKAIEYIKKENTDISMIDKMNILDILRGKDNENNSCN